MQTIFRYFFGFLASASLVLLAGTNTFGQNTLAPDNTSKALVYGGSPELKRSDKIPPSDSERINALEETLRRQGDQLDEMRKLLVEQQETIKLLAGKLTGNRAGADGRRNRSCRQRAFGSCAARG